MTEVLSQMSTPTPDLKKYVHVPVTKHERKLSAQCWDAIIDTDLIVDWADLVTLDLSLFDTPDGKQKLAEQLKDAVHRIGIEPFSFP